MTTKEKILDLFQTASDFVSGEELASQCGVSRAAVHKAITALRSEGYEIEAVTNRGYKISGRPDRISGEKILEELVILGTRPGNIFAFDAIDSTNSECKRQSAEIGSFRKSDGNLTEGGEKLHRSLFVAEQQTAGRGRMGRVFVSPPDSGVYFSLIYSPKKGITNPALLTAAAAVSESLAVDELYGTRTQIKWVNDVFLEGKNGLRKISGILTEGISNFETGTIESAIVGIGINVRNSGFDEELAKVAGDIEGQVSSFGSSLDQKKNSRNKIVAHVVHHLLRFYDAFETNDKKVISEMLSEYKSRSILIGKEVTVNPAAGLQGESYRAKVLDISDEAELIVETLAGEKKSLHSGEVSLHSFDFV